MKKLSYTFAALAVTGFSLLPANAVEKEITNNTIVPDATKQITESTESHFQMKACIWIPGYGWVGC